MTPRYPRFLVTGAAAGLLVALVLVVTRGHLVTRPMALLFYLAILLGGLGALVGGGVAVVLEARRRRR